MKPSPLSPFFARVVAIWSVAASCSGLELPLICSASFQQMDVPLQEKQYCIEAQSFPTVPNMLMSILQAGNILQVWICDLISPLILM